VIRRSGEVWVQAVSIDLSISASMCVRACVRMLLRRLQRLGVALARLSICSLQNESAPIMSQQPPPGVSKGTPGDAKCVTEILKSSWEVGIMKLGGGGKV